MDISGAIQYSASRLSQETFGLGSLFSIYSLTTTFSIAFTAFLFRHQKRRGRFKPQVILRAILSKKIYYRQSVIADVNLYILSVILMPAVLGSFVISSHTVSVIVDGFLSSLFPTHQPIIFAAITIKVFATIALFLAYEIGYWVDHYLKHKIPILWSFHKLHHTADTLTPLTNFRNHPLDNVVFGYMLSFFIGGMMGVLLWLFGDKADFFSVDGKNIIFIVFLWTIGHLQHSEFWIAFTGIWGKIFLSPAHHQIHHSNDPSHFNRNFGSVLAIWDYLFGTLEMPTEKNPRLKYGVSGAASNEHSINGMFVAPIIEAFSLSKNYFINAMRSLTIIH